MSLYIYFFFIFFLGSYFLLVHFNSLMELTVTERNLKKKIKSDCDLSTILCVHICQRTLVFWDKCERLKMFTGFFFPFL